MWKNVLSKVDEAPSLEAVKAQATDLGLTLDEYVARAVIELYEHHDELSTQVGL